MRMSGVLGAILALILMIMSSSGCPAAIGAAGLIAGTAVASGNTSPGIPPSPTPVNPRPTEPAPTEPAPTEPAPTQQPTSPVDNPPVPSDDAPVFMIADLYMYSGGSVTRHTYWTYREDGAITGYAYSSSSTPFQYLDYDINGFVTRENSGGSDTITEIVYENGLAVAEVDNPGSSNEQVTEYQYYSDGSLSAMLYNSGSTETHYDKAGHIIDYISGSSITTYEFHFGSDGRVTGWTTDTGSSKYELTCDTDEFGNIIAVYDSSGALLAEASYERIDDPCLAARVFSVVRANAFMVRDMR